jgi:hypothetical protein
LADHALFKMVRYVLLRPLRPELEIQLEQFKEASSKPAQLKAFSIAPNFHSSKTNPLLVERF